MKLAYEISDKDEAFTHIDKDTGEMRHFAIGVMNKFAFAYAGSCQDIICQTLGISEQNIEILEAYGGIEEHRIKRFDEQHRDKPILGIYWGDGTFTVVDGNHRVLRRWRDGFKIVKAFCFKFPFWEQFLFDLNVDKDKMREWVQSNGFSGIV